MRDAGHVVHTREIVDHRVESRVLLMTQPERVRELPSISVPSLDHSTPQCDPPEHDALAVEATARAVLVEHFRRIGERVEAARVVGIVVRAERHEPAEVGACGRHRVDAAALPPEAEGPVHPGCPRVRDAQGVQAGSATVIDLPRAPRLDLTDLEVATRGLVHGAEGSPSLRAPKQTARSRFAQCTPGYKKAALVTGGEVT